MSSCGLEPDKIVSLCARPEAGPKTTALTYRYGKLGAVENEYTATPENGLRFSAMAGPAAPRASVKQVWFERGAVRYLLTECVGGACPYAGGLAVLNSEQVLMKRRCRELSDVDQPFFSRSLIDFGTGLEDSRSFTPLLRLEGSDNSLHEIYRTGRPPY